MKRATSATFFQDAVGMRMSVTYSEIDDATGQVIADNRRVTKVLTDSDDLAKAAAVIAVAQSYIEDI